MEEHRPRRVSVKTHQPHWKEKLRENCFKRVSEDRAHLLWKMRLSEDSSLDHPKEMMESTFRDLVSDELKKMKASSISTSINQADDALWEYDGLSMSVQSSEAECEEIMIEMQRIFYEDLRREQSANGIFFSGLVEEGDYEGTFDAEDEHLAQELFEHMQLNNDQECKKVVWCPICKHGKLWEDQHLVYCSCCKLQLNRGDEVNLEHLQARLGEAYSEHLDRGCRQTPKFRMETRFNLTALYIYCEACNTLEVVL